MAGLAIMRYWDRPEGETLQIISRDRYRRNSQVGRRATTPLVLACILMAACNGPAPIAAETAPEETGDAACIEDGRLSVDLYGSIRASIDWQSDGLTCTGMPRPDNKGARIRMSGALGTGDEDRVLAFILGIPDLQIGQTGSELPTNVTLIEEGAGRFFGSRDTSDCWTDVSGQDSIDANDERTYRIEGTLYCVSPLAELNGNASVTFTELKFVGSLNWEKPE